MSFDVEDWYMGLEIGMERWGGFEKRLGRGLEVVLDELARASARATFFVVGRCAEEHPHLIRSIAEAGHEIGTHGYSHTKVYEMTPSAFEEDLARSIRAISDATGQPVRAFRAPYFSITAESRWALDLLPRHGIAYDASIYPGPNYRYGIDGSPETPYLVGDPPIPEFPTTLGRLSRVKFGLGGAYFRILPYAVTRHCIARLNRAGQPVMFYLHPWEFDPGQPRIRMPRRRAQLTHYFRLGVTRRRFARLLSDFRFSTASDVLTRMKLLAAPAPAQLAPAR
jgi:polysaccharide deacetylase family protein (PEP-CTERM system associated)